MESTYLDKTCQWMTSVRSPHGTGARSIYVKVCTQKTAKKTKIQFQLNTLGSPEKNKGLAEMANPLELPGVPNRTPTVLRKTYPTDIL
jgi:hypothetical protein